MTEEPNTWRIDKRIPVSVILTLLVQTAAVIIWAMTLQTRIALLEASSIRSETLISMSTDIALVKQDISSVKEEIRRLSVRGK